MSLVLSFLAPFCAEQHACHQLSLKQKSNKPITSWTMMCGRSNHTWINQIKWEKIGFYCMFVCLFKHLHCLTGLVVRRPPQEWKVPRLIPACNGAFSGSSHTSDLKIGTPVATLPGAWRYRVSAWTGRPGVSIRWLGEMESLICNFYLSVAAHTTVWADPFLRYIHMLLGH